MNLSDLEPEQLDIVNAVCTDNERVLAVGRPGTGKTTAALWTAQTHLSQAPASERVLFLSFSRAAVSQIVQRQRSAMMGLADRIEIMTFHALAYRLIRAFGQYAGLTGAPEIQSEARYKLLGSDGGKLRYKDLLPLAHSLIADSALIGKLVRERWSLVICDEAQDLSAEQLAFLKDIAKSKVLLLGDPDQMIYEFTGASSEVFADVQRWATKRIDLSPRSHRDPSGLMPAVAEAVRSRDFLHEALTTGIESGRLVFHFNVSDPMAVACEEVRAALEEPGDVGVFMHGNSAVSELADVLNQSEIDHVLVGIPEAEAEALSCMSRQVSYAAGLADRDEVLVALALFLTAAVRTRDAPAIALGFVGQDELPEQVANRLDDLFLSLRSDSVRNIEDAAQIALQSWVNLGIAQAYRAWAHAAAHFARLSQSFSSMPLDEQSVTRLDEVIAATRTDTLIFSDYTEQSRVKLMNYHQTKGREADTVIHVFRDDEYYGKETEPFTSNSRLLNVALSRARRRLIIILPPSPHKLVDPYYLLSPGD